MPLLSKTAGSNKRTPVCERPSSSKFCARGTDWPARRTRAKSGRSCKSMLRRSLKCRVDTLFGRSHAKVAWANRPSQLQNTQSACSRDVHSYLTAIKEFSCQNELVITCETLCNFGRTCTLWSSDARYWAHLRLEVNAKQNFKLNGLTGVAPDALWVSKLNFSTSFWWPKIYSDEWCAEVDSSAFFSCSTEISSCGDTKILEKKKQLQCFDFLCAIFDIGPTCFRDRFHSLCCELPHLARLPHQSSNTVFLNFALTRNLLFEPHNSLGTNWFSFTGHDKTCITVTDACTTPPFFFFCELQLKLIR